MTEIPEDIEIAAYDCARGIYLAVDDGGPPYLTEDDIEEIAKAILAERNSHASLTEERDRLREENARLLAFVRSFKFTCVEDSFYKDCYLNIVEPDSASFRLGNGSQFSLFIGKLEERRAALSPPTAEGREP